jgi:hypothetical protein
VLILIVIVVYDVNIHITCIVTQQDGFDKVCPIYFMLQSGQVSWYTLLLSNLLSLGLDFSVSSLAMVFHVVYEIFTIEFLKSLVRDFVSLPVYVNFACILLSFSFSFLGWYLLLRHHICLLLVCVYCFSFFPFVFCIQMVTIQSILQVSNSGHFMFNWVTRIGWDDCVCSSVLPVYTILEFIRLFLDCNI